MRSTSEPRGNQSGQVEVETAIVLPLAVFLLLGLLQLGLLHQARIIAEYSAYRAVRTGSLRVYQDREDWIRGMEAAAVAAALPILSYSQGLMGGPEILSRTDSPFNWAKKWSRPGFGGFPQNKMIDLATLIKYAEVRICGPEKSDVQGNTYSVQGTEFVPFDNPEVAGRGIKTKLRIEVTLNVRMIIPFADWVFYHMWRGWKISDELHLGQGAAWNPLNPSGWKYLKYDIAARLAKVYMIPIRAQYAMKMHSDIPLDHLPDSNECM